MFIVAHDGNINYHCIRANALLAEMNIASVVHQRTAKRAPSFERRWTTQALFDTAHQKGLFLSIGDEQRKRCSITHTKKGSFFRSEMNTASGVQQRMRQETPQWKSYIFLFLIKTFKIIKDQIRGFNDKKILILFFIYINLNLIFCELHRRTWWYMVHAVMIDAQNPIFEP